MAAAQHFRGKGREKRKRGRNEKEKQKLVNARLHNHERARGLRAKLAAELKTRKNAGLKTGITLRCNYVIRLRGTSRREV